MLIHQAIYGDRGGAHVLLAASSKSNVPFAQLVVRTDQPGTPVSKGFTWKPYISGFAFGDWYVLGRSFPDPHASRGGMVRTHLLAAPLEEVSELQNLARLLDHLPKTLEDVPAISEDALPSIEVTKTDPQKDGLGEERPGHKAMPALTKVVSLLVGASSSGKPVVWIGEEGLSDIVLQLWLNLWPSARKKLNFRTSFGPQDVEGQDWTLVATPAALESRWAGYPKVRSSDLHTPETRAEALLLGQPHGEPLRGLLEGLDNPPIDIRQLRALERACELLNRLAHLSAAEARELTHLIATLVPSRQEGRVVKTRILSKLSAVTAQGRAIDIMGLRNVATDALPGAKTAIATTIEGWFARLEGASSALVSESAEIVRLGFTEAASEAEQTWKSDVMASVSAVIKKWEAQAAKMVWLWWRQDETLVQMLEGLLPTHKKVETDLVQHCPTQLLELLGASVRGLAQRRDWYRLHGAAVAAFMDAPRAIEAQLALGTDRTLQLAGLRVLADRLPAEQVVQVALRENSEPLYCVAGELCAQHPHLLSRIDVREQAWCTLWLRAIEAGAEPFAGIDGPQTVMYSLMDLLLKSKPVDVTLLRGVGKTEYANLVTYPSRASVWPMLEPHIARDFLERTAQGWLDQFRRDPSFDNKLESELERHILAEDTISRYLDLAQAGAVRAGISLFSRFRNLNEDRFVRWLWDLRLTGPSVDTWDARSMGKMISEKHWRRAAEALTESLLTSNRTDLEPAVQECTWLLGWFLRFQLVWSGKLHGATFTETDWWNALEELLVELYPYGPEDRSIWERAGGDASSLRSGSTGEDRWKRAINFLKNGGGKHISGQSILQEVRREYPNSDKTKQLEEAMGRLRQRK